MLDSPSSSTQPIEWVGGTYREESLEKGLKSSNDPFRAIIRGVAMNDEIDGPMESFEFPDPDEANPTLVLSAGTAQYLFVTSLMMP